MYVKCILKILKFLLRYISKDDSIYLSETVIPLPNHR